MNDKIIRWSSIRLGSIGAILVTGGGASADGAEIKLVHRKPGPYGSPRPAAGQQHVPLLNSIYFELAVEGGDAPDKVLPESVSIRLEPEGGWNRAIPNPNATV